MSNIKINKLDMKTEEVVDKNIEKIGEIFPNVIVESENGKLIDFELLKQELSKDILEGTKEKYALIWPGKREAILTANTSTTNTLRPIKEKSVDFDNTKNIYIEGDNLEALKILQESYLGKIKCIYIDPPYNTGNDFVYNDKFAKKREEELIESGVVDDEGNYLTSKNINQASEGRYHSKWLSMMYPRLKLARNVLSEDGLIFISIDDNELYNLKKICDEIFGEKNFVNCISIKMSELSGVKMKFLKKYPKLKESLLIYSKNFGKSDMLVQSKQKNLENYLKYYSNVIVNKDEPVEDWKIESIKDYFKREGIDETEIDINEWKMENADRVVYRTNSRTVKTYMKSHPEAPQICKIINNDGNEIIKWDDKEMLFLEKYINEYLGDIWTDISTININKESYMKVFENGQKPLQLIDRIINSVAVDEDEELIVLDFFSGSATTAHSVMRLNATDNKKRKYIMIQIQEQVKSKKYKTICDIGQERIKLAGEKIREEKNGNIDCGFRVYKIDSSNMKDVYYKPNNLKQAQLSMFESNIKKDRTADDLLTQVILDLGLTLDLKIEEKELLKNHVYFVEKNLLVACFDDEINMDILDEICDVKPSKIVFQDKSFKNDKDKINMYEKIKKLSPETEVNVI